MGRPFESQIMAVKDVITNLWDNIVNFFSMIFNSIFKFGLEQMRSVVGAIDSIPMVNMEGAIKHLDDQILGLNKALNTPSSARGGVGGGGGVVINIDGVAGVDPQSQYQAEQNAIRVNKNKMNAANPYGGM